MQENTEDSTQTQEKHKDSKKIDDDTDFALMSASNPVWHCKIAFKTDGTCWYAVCSTHKFWENIIIFF